MSRVTANQNTVQKGISVHRISLARGEGGAISGFDGAEQLALRVLNRFPWRSSDK